MRATFTDDELTPHASNASSDPSRTLIDDYLAEQQRLQTPVLRFSEAHDQHLLDRSQTRWRELIPLTRPGPGEQYAFEVDVDRCTGCKACVAGCHSLNGLEEEETWRDVGLVFGGTRSQPFQQTITSACHHCEDPACLNGCPVLAYEKDPLTGIVRHLDDQCIGCQYCVLKCPYDVPKYSERLGIVRKCDMCHSRLEVGEAPACAQACPTEAIRIVTVRVSMPTEPPADFLPTAPSPDYTRPTTRYLTNKAWPANLKAADAHRLQPQSAHWPLVLMLTLLPLAVGCFSFDAIRNQLSAALCVMGTAALTLGLASSVFHLGQPRRAWRIFLGLRRSWLSREAVVFGGWASFVVGFTVERLLPLSSRMSFFLRYQHGVGLGVAAIGLVGLFCSAMIYVDTRRAFWCKSQTFPRFFGSALVLGSAAAFALYPGNGYAAVLALSLLIKLGCEARFLRCLDDNDPSPSPARHSALLLIGRLRPLLGFRCLLAGAALAASLAFIAIEIGPWVRPVVFILALLGEGTERLLFFRAVFAPKMPGLAA